MPDICDLILDDHAVFRRRFAELDERREAGADELGRLWSPLAELLDRHADAEERIFYPRLLRAADAEDDTEDAIRDHNAIRDAVHATSEHEAGTEGWWQAVDRARAENSDHMAEEERGPLALFRQQAGAELRDQLGSRFVEFNQAHAGGRGVDATDKDPGAYVREHDDG